MNFEFSTTGRIVFGPKTAARIPEEAGALMTRALLVTGRDAGRARATQDALRAAGIAVTVLAAQGEPTVEQAAQGGALARENRCDGVVALGGGAVMDLGKAAAAFAANPGDPFDYLEVVGRGKPLDAAPLPVVAVPTTAGTGAEATRNAVLASPAHKVKVSLRHSLMLPRVAVVDPELTLTCPPDVTAAGGMDAVTQLLEAYCCAQPNALMQGVIREALRQAGPALPRAWERGDDIKARTSMAYAALVSGMALANAKLGAVHGLAAALGGMVEAPHGMLCARLLGPVMKANVHLMHRREPSNAALPRCHEAAACLTGRVNASAESLADWAQEQAQRFTIPGLASWGLARADVPAACDKAARASSMRGNPIELSLQELEEIVVSAL